MSLPGETALLLRRLHVVADNGRTDHLDGLLRQSVGDLRRIVPRLSQRRLTVRTDCGRSSHEGTYMAGIAVADHDLLLEMRKIEVVLERIATALEKIAVNTTPVPEPPPVTGIKVVPGIETHH